MRANSSAVPSNAAATSEQFILAIHGISAADPTDEEDLLGILRSARLQESHWRLSLAILQDAFYCLHKYKRTRIPVHQQEFRDAEAWVNSDSVDWPFAFLVVCDALGMDAVYLRRGAAQWTIMRSNRNSLRDRGRIQIFVLNSNESMSNL